MSAYRMEMSWAVDAQINSLRKVLQQDIDTSQRPQIIRSAIASAPHDDSLFNSFIMYVLIDDDGTAHLQAARTEFNLPHDDVYRYELKEFPTFDELKSWILTAAGVEDFCMEIICGKANL